MTHVLGIDGGGTRTRAAIADETGRVLGEGEAGGANHVALGVEKARASLLEAIDKARSKAGVGETFDAVFAGLAGVGSDADRKLMRPIVASAAKTDIGAVRVDHDLRVAWAGALAARPGVALIAGTGAAAFGVNEQGESHRAGGFGALFDDGGSAYDLGRRAVNAALRAADGRGSSSPLTEAIRAQLGDDLRAGVIELSRDADQRTRIAHLAPLIFEHAAQNDPVAARLVTAGAKQLVACVEAVIRAIPFDADPVPVAATGGLTRAGRAFADPLRAALHARLADRARLAPAVLPPVRGALLLALRELGGDDRAVITALRAEA